jgi:hypothetical protein
MKVMFLIFAFLPLVKSQKEVNFGYPAHLFPFIRFNSNYWVIDTFKVIIPFELLLRVVIVL